MGGKAKSQTVCWIHSLIMVLLMCSGWFLPEGEIITEYGIRIAMIFVGPAIMIESPGPIFFKQKRVGKNGRYFEIYKFRSMYQDAEQRKKEHDGKE